MTVQVYLALSPEAGGSLTASLEEVVAKLARAKVRERVRGICAVNMKEQLQRVKHQCQLGYSTATSFSQAQKQQKGQHGITAAPVVPIAVCQWGPGYSFNSCIHLEPYPPVAFLPCSLSSDRQGLWGSS
jgi:hypothetical protein